MQMKKVQKRFTRSTNVVVYVQHASLFWWKHLLLDLVWKFGKLWLSHS